MLMNWKRTILEQHESDFGIAKWFVEPWYKRLGKRINQYITIF